MIVESLARPPATAQRTVPAGTAVYAIGDVHGRADLLAELHAWIAADAARSRATRRVIVYLGDYVDRGPDSAKVLDLVLDHVPAGCLPVTLLGNHERLMIDFLDSIGVGPAWLRNGGRATLQSYGIDVGMEGEADVAELYRVQAAFRACLPARHLAFLRRLVLTHVEGDYLFVHAGVRPGVNLAEQREEDLIWIRGAFLNSALDHGHVVVHGHSILLAPQIRPNRIGIDTGAFGSGNLTCLALEGAAQRIFQTGA